jgi:uncharacterized protein YijF (DUF1287 family)
VFHESLSRHLRRGFDPVVDGNIASPGQPRVDINLRTWRLDRAAAWRGVVVLAETGKGMPGMVAEYVVKGANDEVLARFTRAEVEASA